MSSVTRKFVDGEIVAVWKNGVMSISKFPEVDTGYSANVTLSSFRTAKVFETTEDTYELSADDFCALSCHRSKKLLDTIVWYLEVEPGR